VRPPTARSLILDLLSTLRRGSMPVAALVQAGALFGLAEGGVRVALTRLLADGRVERDERGSYRLGAAAAPVQDLVSGWRALDRRTRTWNARWLGVSVPEGNARRGAGRDVARALRLLGFEPVAPGLQVRPDNLRGGVSDVRDTLHRLGLPAAVPVFELGGLDAPTDARARALWDGAHLSRRYAEAHEELAASAARMPGLPAERAMTESFLLGGRVLQQLLLDPQLPAPLVDEAARSALLDEMRAYDRLGRQAWAAFLGRFGVPHRAAPADTRWSQAPEGRAQRAAGERSPDVQAPEGRAQRAAGERSPSGLPA
jgi:phenylacetic acid degradation operon negative regulatory protein